MSQIIDNYQSLSKLQNQFKFNHERTNKFEKMNSSDLFKKVYKSLKNKGQANKNIKNLFAL